MQILDGIALAVDLMDVIVWCLGLSSLWICNIHKPVIASIVTFNTILSYLVTAMM